MATYTATHKDVDYTPSGVTASDQQKLDVWNGAAGQKLPCVLVTGFSGWSLCKPKIDSTEFGTAAADDREILDDDPLNIGYRVAQRLLQRGDFVVVDVRLSIAMGAEISTLTPSYSNLNSPTIKPYTPYTDEYDPNDLDAGGTQQYGTAVNGYGVTNPPGFTYRTTVGAVASGSATATPGETVMWDDATWHMAPKDLRMAWDYLVQNATTYGIDPDRIIVMGISAGGLEVLRLRKKLDLTDAQRHTERIGSYAKPLGILGIDVPARLHAMIQQNRLGSPDGITGWMGPQGTQGHDPASGAASQWSDGDSAIAAPGIGDMDVAALDVFDGWVTDPDYTNTDVPAIVSYSVANQLPLVEAKRLDENPGTSSTGLTDFHALDHGIFLKAKGLVSEVYYHNATPSGDLDADVVDYLDGTLVTDGNDTEEIVKVFSAQAVEWAYGGSAGGTGTYMHTHASVTLATGAWSLLYPADPTGERIGAQVSTDGAAEVASTINEFHEPTDNDGAPIATADVTPYQVDGSGAVWARATAGTPEARRAGIYRGTPDLSADPPGAPPVAEG